MIDVGGDDGAPARHFAPYELRRDPVGNGSAEAFAVARHRAAEIFARRDELHLLSDEALARVVQLRDVAAGFRAQGSAAGTVELRHGQQFAGRADLVALDDFEVIAEDDKADRVLFEVERLPAHLGAREFDQLAGHDA